MTDTDIAATDRLMSRFFGPTAGELFAALAGEEGSAAGPLGDCLEEMGESSLAAHARLGRVAFLGRVLDFLRAEHFDPATMRVVVMRRPGSRVDRRWIAWRSIEAGPGHWLRAAMATKGCPDPED